MMQEDVLVVALVVKEHVLELLLQFFHSLFRPMPLQNVSVNIFFYHNFPHLLGVAGATIVPIQILDGQTRMESILGAQKTMPIRGKDDFVFGEEVLCNFCHAGRPPVRRRDVHFLLIGCDGFHDW